MNKVFSIFITVIFIGVISIIIFAIATISLTEKINQDREKYQTGIAGTVEKQEVPVVGFSNGVITKINVNQGEEVKKGQLLAEIDNPVLREQYNSLKTYTKDNVSAQTQAAIAKSQLENNQITSPVDGIVDSVSVTTNSPVDEYTKIATIFANDNAKILAYLTTDQYVAAQKLNKVKAYDVRLNQDILIKPDILKPNQENPAAPGDHKIALYFRLVNPKDALSLLNGEQLQLKLSPPQQELIKPLDYIVNFWNRVLHKDTAVNF